MVTGGHSRPRDTERGAAGGILITQITELGRLKPLREVWDRLLLESPLPNPMLSFVWVVAALEHFVMPGEEWVCLMAHDGSVLLGVMPLILCPRTFGTFRGAGLRTPFNWHVLAGDCLVKEGYEDRVIPLMLQSARTLDPLYAGLTLTRLGEGSPALQVMQRGVDGFVSVRGFNGSGSYITISGSYENYLASLETRFVRNLRRLDRKLQSLEGLEMSVISEDAGNEDYCDRYLQLENRSWRKEKGTAIIQTPVLREFYSDLTRKLGERGWLEWYFLSAKGRTVAAMMTIRVGRRQVVYKIGYDEAYASYSPGSKLFEKMIQRVHAMGEIQEVDCLTTYPWNQNWNMTIRNYYDLTIFPARPTVLLAGYLPARVLNLLRHGSHWGEKCSVLFSSAVKSAMVRKKRSRNGGNGLSL